MSEYRLIYAEPIEKFIQDGLNNKDPNKNFGYDCICILGEIYAAQTIKPDDLIPKGEWICVAHNPHENGYGVDALYKCSHCNSVDDDGNPDYESYLSKYCPNCGAKMAKRGYNISIRDYDNVYHIVIPGKYFYTINVDGNRDEFTTIAHSLEELEDNWFTYTKHYNPNLFQADILRIKRHS